MKKLLALALFLTLAFCALSQAEESKEWTLEGTFVDEEENYLVITASFEEDVEGWYVGLMLGDGMYYGATIPQEGDSLHGNLDSEGGEYIVTVSEEGEDGILLTLESGEEYHFAPYEIPSASIIVTVNTDGLGGFAYAEGEEIPEYVEDSHSQSIYLGLEEPTTYSFVAEAEEGYRFVKWKMNGKTISAEPELTMEFTESADLVAVFMIFNPYAKEPVSDIEDAKTIGDVLGLPSNGYAIYEKAFVMEFELNDIAYRAVAEMEDGGAEAFYELDYDDPDYQKKFAELTDTLPITKVENLSEQSLTQEELDELVGKTGQELLDCGFTCNGWDLYSMTFFMDQGIFSYKVVFDGEVENEDDFKEEDILPMTVVSVTFDQIGDALYMEEYAQ